MMMGINDLPTIITKIDIFGQGIDLRIDKLIKSKTLFGGILTILMLMLLFSMFFVSSQDVLNHTNPNISVEQQIISESPPIYLDSNTMPISISLTVNGNMALYKPEYFDYFFSVRYGETTAESLEEVFYNLTQCRKDLFPMVTQEAYDKLNMDQNLCVDGQNVTLSGGWSEKYISYLSIRIAVCTDPQRCASYQEIEDYIKTNTFYWNLYYMNTNVNPQDYETPISYNLVNYYKLIKLGSYKLSEVFIRPQTLKSDGGFIFETNIYTESLAFDFEIYDDSAIDDSQTLVEFNLYLSTNKFIYHRKYKKIQEVLANVGGLANLLRILFVIICYIFSIVKRDEIILNKIFEFDLRHQNRLLPNGKKATSFLSKFKNMNNDKKLHDEKIANNNTKSCNVNLLKSQAKSRRRSIIELISNDLPVRRNLFSNENTIKATNTFYLDDDRNEKSPRNISHLKKKLDQKSKIRRNSSLFSSSTFRSKIINNSLPEINNNQSHILNSYKLTPREEQVSAHLPENSNNFLLNNIEKDKKPNLSKRKYSTTPHKKIHVPLSVDPSKDLPYKEMSKAKKMISFFEQRNKRNELRFTFWETIKAFLCGNFCMDARLFSKKKLYNKSNNVIEEFLDITFIIQKLEEFEKFKLTTFSREQLALFNFISKELISLDTEKTSSHGMTTMKNFSKDKENLVNIILKFKEKLKNAEDLDPVDKKLFDLINEEFK